MHAYTHQSNVLVKAKSLKGGGVQRVYTSGRGVGGGGSEVSVQYRQDGIVVD